MAQLKGMSLQQGISGKGVAGRCSAYDDLVQQQNVGSPAATVLLP